MGSLGGNKSLISRAGGAGGGGGGGEDTSKDEGTICLRDHLFDLAGKLLPFVASRLSKVERKELLSFDSR